MDLISRKMMFLQILTFLYLALLTGQIKGIPCYFGQEPDPKNMRRIRWTIDEEDPCLCTNITIGGMNSYNPYIPYDVTYYDSFFISTDALEIRKLLNCTVIACSPLPALANGNVTCVRNNHDSVIESTCNATCGKGYTLKGSSRRVCRKNGTWNAADAKCEVVTCPSPAEPANGIISTCNLNNQDLTITDQFPVGSSCVVQCNPQYILSSSVNPTCLLNGTWTANDVVCKTVKSCATIGVDISKFTGSSNCSNSVLHRGTNCTLTWTDHSGQTAYGWMVYEHVGLEDSNIIPDESFEASSDDGWAYAAKEARLHFNGGWISSSRDPWIEVDLVTARLVSGVITQGSIYNPSTAAYRVTKYQVSYQTASSPGVYQDVKDSNGNTEIFTGNLVDGKTPVIQLFKETIEAKLVRILSLECDGASPCKSCLRLELLGCRLDN